MFRKTGKLKKNKRSQNAPPFYDEPQNRLYILGGFWALCFLAILLKLLFVQVVEHGHYEAIAKSHLEQRRELPAQRGSISDRNGDLLAVDLIHYSLAVKPSLLSDRQKVAEALGKVLQVAPAKLVKRMKGNANFAYLEHRISHEKAEALRKLNLDGVILEKKFSRYYPYKTSGAQTIGYCDYDNAAKGGLELEYDKYLKGTSGWSVYLQDALGNQFPNLDFPTSYPVNGMSLETTIDMFYQSVLEDELEKAVRTHKANNGSAVLLDPRTGEVLGMANYPGFDPNRYNDFDLANYRNRAMTDLYEPGSTFKMVALALCIEELNLNMNKELVYCENGKYALAQKVVRDHEDFGYLSARGVFENSSNIGVIKLSKKFKPPIFYRYARDFGFGQQTGVDLPAEASGILGRPADYSRYSVAYMSIGYEVAVSPLQVASAYAAVANGGKLMKPYVVKRVIDDNGRVQLENQPQVIRQVVSAETAARMKEILKGVVENGTGQNAQVSGVAIAGKTGTAQKFDRSTHSYSTSQHVGSFAGFFPVESPKFVLLVMINNPRNGYYGSQVAAPAFSNIAQRIIGLPVTVKREQSPEMARLELPALDNFVMPLEGMKLKSAEKLLKERKLTYQVVGNGSLIYRQEPAPYSPLKASEPIRLYTETREVSSPGNNVMPKLVGLTLKEALQVMSQWNINVEIEGTGVVVEQRPSAGKNLSKENKIKLVCNPA
ncbi:MAG: PASTA domain-containing protein [Calditrichae bacterium]|nr:PASTA domain-containing protein [Calditrichia bacterium]